MIENLEGEIWKTIPKLINRYEVSNFGRIKDIKTQKLRKLQDNGNGYKCFGIEFNEKRKNFYVHRKFRIFSSRSFRL